MKAPACQKSKLNPQKNKSLRLVRPFSISSYQKNTQAYPPRKINTKEERKTTKSLFRILFLRGDIPCQQSFAKITEHEICSRFLMWKLSSPQDLNYSYYLPIFFDGLCEADFPYNLIARHAIHDLLNAAPDKILPVIPKIIVPLRKALTTKNLDIINACLKIIQHMCIVDSCIAKALIPYFRQILPTFNLYRDCNVNIMDGIDYDRSGRLGDTIEDTLTILEYNGGTDAFINIKYCIPTYESCVSN